MFEADTFSYRILPFSHEKDSAVDLFNMPIVDPYSSDPMPNFFSVEPGVEYFMLNSMGPDHFIQTDSLEKNLMEPPLKKKE